MSDFATFVLAAAVWLGTLVAAPVPRWLAATVSLAAIAGRRPWLLVVGCCALASGLGAASWRGLDPPASRHLHASAVVASDPVHVGHAIRADLRVHGRRVEAWARGAAAAMLRERQAGQVVEVRGRLRPPPDAARERLAVRHVSARLDLTDVAPSGAGAPVVRVANRIRAVLNDGASPLPPERRALLLGFLIGDVREVPPVVAADFRAAGMTHLLAVSGSNVAFVLAVAGPALRRMQLRGRFALSLAVIALFAVVTRAEPSVLRASVMAAIACWAAFAGRPVSRVRVLALAVAALVLVDPMLPRSVGFQLSVGASLGLILLAAPIARRLPGPRWLAEPLAVTAAAQIGVAPVLIQVFGGLPLVAVVANLLAVPVAGPLTAWGLTAGFVAGTIGPPVDALLQAPTSLLVGWVATVARHAANVPLGNVGAGALVVAIVVGLAASRIERRRLALALPLAVLVLAARPPGGALDGAAVARGAHVWRDGGVVLALDGGADGGRVVEGLRRLGVRRVDLVVARRGGRNVGGVVVDLRSRIALGAIAAPDGHRIRYATAIVDPLDLVVGRLRVSLVPADGAVHVQIAS